MTRTSPSMKRRSVLVALAAAGTLVASAVAGQEAEEPAPAPVG